MASPERSAEYRRALWDRLWSEWLLAPKTDDQPDEAATDADEDQAAA